MSRVLIVDDSSQILETTAKVLRASGYDVSTSDTCEESLDIFTDEPDIDIVIMDLVMHGLPISDTLDAMSLIRPFRLILMTGYTMVEVDATISRDRVDAVLIKPWAVDDLLESIKG